MAGCAGLDASRSPGGEGLSRDAAGEAGHEWPADPLRARWFTLPQSRLSWSAALRLA